MSVRDLVFGLGPATVLAVAAWANLAASKQGSELSVPIGLLFILTLGFAVYSLRRHGSLAWLPFIWTALLLVEFVLSPSIDILLGIWPLDEVGFPQSMGTAATAATLFLVGMWIATALAGRGNTVRALHNDSLTGAQGGSRGARELALIVFLCVLSFAAQTAVLMVSGALAGDVMGARLAGLTGTSVLNPLVRLSDYAALIASWAGVTSVDPRARRRFLIAGLLAMATSMWMPIMLGQRFGLLQAVAYFAYPRVLAARMGAIFSPRFVIRFFTVALLAVMLVNVVTSAIRGAYVSDQAFNVDEISQEKPFETKSVHLRHLWLLEELIASGGVGPSGVGSMYQTNPIWGDLLVVLPRAWFPDKPVSSFEVVNGMLFGFRYTSADRGVQSLFTPGLWTQMFVIGGSVWMLLLAAGFAFGSLRLWAACARRAYRLNFMIAAGSLWIQCGWLAMNGSFTTIELPGMLFAMGMVVIFGAGGRGNQAAWEGRPSAESLPLEPASSMTRGPSAR